MSEKIKKYLISFYLISLLIPIFIGFIIYPFIYYRLNIYNQFFIALKNLLSEEIIITACLETVFACSWVILKMKNVEPKIDIFTLTINKMSETVFLNDFISKIIDALSKENKTREMNICLIKTLNKGIEYISNLQWIEEETMVFSEAKKIVEKVPPYPINKIGVIRVNLVSLIDPLSWTLDNWKSYDATISQLKVTYPNSIIKRIHIVNERDFKLDKFKKNLYRLVLKELCNGLRIQIALINTKEIQPLYSPLKDGYVFHDAHLHDYGLYKGYRDTHVIISNIIPYFSGSQNSVKIQIIKNAEICDLLLSNFNYIWSDAFKKSKSLWAIINENSREKNFIKEIIDKKNNNFKKNQCDELKMLIDECHSSEEQFFSKFELINKNC